MPLHKSNSRPRWRAVLPLAAIIPSILAFCLSIPGAARTKVPPWIAKDWRQWSDDDCDAVLNNSPWGQMASTGGYASTSGPNVSSVVVATVQLRSALPIRQALLRKQQLLSFYSRMKRDKKQDFDRAHLHDLDPTSQVLIYIANSSSTTLPPGGSGSLTYQAPASPAAQPALQLADGTTIRPTEATILGKMDASGSNVQYSFPRTIGGKAVLSPTDSSLLIELGNPLLIYETSGKVDQQAPFRNSGAAFIFRTADMMYKGRLEY